MFTHVYFFSAPNHWCIMDQTRTTAVAHTEQLERLEDRPRSHKRTVAAPRPSACPGPRVTSASVPTGLDTTGTEGKVSWYRKKGSYWLKWQPSISSSERAARVRQERASCAHCSCLQVVCWRPRAQRSLPTESRCLCLCSGRDLVTLSAVIIYRDDFTEIISNHRELTWN